jgi:hypothetical protein
MFGKKLAKENERLRKENKQLTEILNRKNQKEVFKGWLYGLDSDKQQGEIKQLKAEIIRLEEELVAVTKERDWLKQMSTQLFETAKKEKVKKNS